MNAQNTFNVGDTVTSTTTGWRRGTVAKVNMKTLLVDLSDGNRVKAHIYKDSIIPVSAQSAPEPIATPTEGATP